MACTFAGLDLEALGIVGDHEVQYASYEATLSRPQGHDGDVLANFRRGSTRVSFDLTLTGGASEMVNKMNLLAQKLAQGAGELVLPDQTPGYHLYAVPDCTLAPKDYVDGFVLPLAFVVPDGCASTDNPQTARIDGPTEVTVGGFMPVDWKLHVEGSDVPSGVFPAFYPIQLMLDGEVIAESTASRPFDWIEWDSSEESAGYMPTRGSDTIARTRFYIGPEAIGPGPHSINLHGKSIMSEQWIELPATLSWHEVSVW